MIDVISASAGTGKTHRLSTYLQEALLRPGPGAPRPEGVVAITYTRKAAAELRHRLRRRLMEAGRLDLAARIRDGYVGTIHAVCRRLLQEHALEAGLSPALAPTPESEERLLFRMAIADAAGEDDAAMEAAAERMGLPDWRLDVERVVAGARANGLTADDLRAAAERSLRGFVACLAPPSRDADRADAAVLAALERCVPDLEASAEASGTAQRNAERASRLLAAARSGRAPWGELVWVRSVASMKRHREAGAALCAEVDRLDDHPRLRADAATVLAGVMEGAARVLHHYAARKARAGVIDYGDMLEEVRRLLCDPQVRRGLADRLDLLLVDEFQDTSPIQLAVIGALADVAGTAVWVGDRKQAIYSFQGSDPDLMDAAAARALHGRTAEVLGQSWRSRPGLVAFTSAVFACGLRRHGFDPAEVRVEPRHDDPPWLADRPCLELWRGDDGAWPDCLAAGVRALLLEAPRLRAWDGRREEGPVRPGDVAVLCRTNAHCGRVAEALRSVGVPASVARAGLTRTAEGELARAALAVLCDPGDTLAPAVVSWLTGPVTRPGGGAGPDAWLGGLLDEAAARRAAADAGEARPLLFATDPAVAALRACRDEAARLSPSEALDLALAAADLPDVCGRWPRPAERLANLEALRGLSRDYEALCAARRGACTAAGLVAHLAHLPPADPSNRCAAPTDADLVHVVTYHGAKGLEWPVTVLASLSSPTRRPAFGVHVEPAATFDAAAPLAGRWVRYWPWPFGLQGRSGPVAERAARTPEAMGKAARDEREFARLLYVGCTRARDLLVLFAESRRGGDPDVGWLDVLAHADGSAVADLPWGAEAGPSPAAVGAVVHVREQGGAVVLAARCGVRALRPGPAAAVQEAERRGFGAPGPANVPNLAERLRPSADPAPAGIGTASTGEVVLLGPRPDPAPPAGRLEALGSALHAYLGAADGADPTPLIESWGVADVARPDAFRAMREALAAGVRARWPGARWLREHPLRWHMPDGRLLVGEADLVLETGAGYVVVDHKSYPGDAAGRDGRVAEYAGQLAWYGRALEAATGRPVLGLWLHFPFRGELVEVLV